MQKMPVWADVVLIPLVSLFLAALLSAAVIVAIGEDPQAAIKLMISGALGSTCRRGRIWTRWSLPRAAVSMRSRSDRPT